MGGVNVTATTSVSRRFCPPAGELEACRFGLRGGCRALARIRKRPLKVTRHADGASCPCHAEEPQELLASILNAATPQVPVKLSPRGGDLAAGSDLVEHVAGVVERSEQLARHIRG